MHLRDHRLVHIEQLDAQALALLQPPDIVVDFLAASVFGAAARGEFVQIRTGTEMRAGAAQHDGVDGVVFIGLQQRRVQLAQQLSGQRVAAFGPVQRDDGGGAAHLVGDLFELHGVSSGTVERDWLESMLCAGLAGFNR